MLGCYFVGSTGAFISCVYPELVKHVVCQSAVARSESKDIDLFSAEVVAGIILLVETFPI